MNGKQMMKKKCKASIKLACCAIAYIKSRHGRIR